MGHLLAHGHPVAGQQQPHRLSGLRVGLDCLGQPGGGVGPGLGEQGLLLGLGLGLQQQCLLLGPGIEHQRLGAAAGGIELGFALAL